MADHKLDCTSQGASYSAMTVSFLAGGIAGAAVALLLAPQSGRVTRGIMGRKLNDATDSGRELKGRMVEKLHDAADSARELKDRTIRRGQEIREEATYRVEGAASVLAGKPGQKDRGNGDLKGDSSA
jgi:gas vesicle protein